MRFFVRLWVLIVQDVEIMVNVGVVSLIVDEEVGDLAIIVEIALVFVLLDHHEHTQEKASAHMRQAYVEQADVVGICRAQARTARWLVHARR